MKITNDKGIKTNISSFFHTKSTENEYKKLYISLIILLGFIFFVYSLLIFLLIERLIISILLILIGGIFAYLLKDKYSQLIIRKIINKKESIKKNKELKSKYKYSQLNYSNTKKKKKISKYLNKKKLDLNFFKKSDNNNDSYIEIK